MKNFGRTTAAALAAIMMAACSDSGVVQPEMDVEVDVLGMATIIPTEESTVDLVAGQNEVIGYVEVLGNDPFQVRYVITDPDWCIVETHVGVADELGDEGIPVNKKGNPKIGQFPYGEEDIGCLSEWTSEEIPLPADTNGDGQYLIAAHAVVQMCETVVIGDGTDFLFGIHDGQLNGDGDLYKVDPTTGEATLVYDYAEDPSSDIFSPNGLAFSEELKRLYFSVDPDGDDDTGPTEIWYFATDGSMTDPLKAGEVSEFPVYNASWYQGEYYYIPNRTDELFKASFDATGTSVTGSTSVCTDVVMGAGTSLAFGDIAIDAETGVLYGWARNTSSNDYFFFSIDVDDCSGKTQTNVTDVHGTSFNLQLALGSDGTLWGHQSLSANGPNQGQWYEVDKTTGALTNQFVTSLSFTDVSFGPAGTTEERICTGEEETAWADGQDGLRFTEQGSWATYFIFEPVF